MDTNDIILNNAINTIADKLDSNSLLRVGEMVSIVIIVCFWLACFSDKDVSLSKEGFSFTRTKTPSYAK